VAGIASDWAVLDEVPTPLEGVGGVLLLAGVAATTLRVHRRRVPRPHPERVETAAQAPTSPAQAPTSSAQAPVACTSSR